MDHKADYAIQIKRIIKLFKIKKSRDTTLNLLKRCLLSRSSDTNFIYALNDININIFRGENIAVVGNNGSGKTTLLKIIAGLYRPTEGQVHVNGEMVLMRGLGIGMVDELSVKENIFLYGAIYHVDKQTIKEQFDDIIQWAELQEFAEAKLKTLSSGMKAKLAFSVLRHFKTDIFLLDEAFSAIDKNFNEKCEKFFEHYTTTQKTFLVATHDLNFARMFCKKTLWLHKGKQTAFDETEIVLKQYMESKEG